MKTKTLILAASFAAAAFGATGVAHAQSKQGYAVDTSNMVWRNYSNECWRAGYWTPSMAIAECDPDLVPKPAPAPKPAAAPAPAPAPKPAAKPAAAPAKQVVLRTTVTFPTNNAELDAGDKAKLDGDIVGKLGTVGAISFVNVNGHTDRGSGWRCWRWRLESARASSVLPCSRSGSSSRSRS